MAADLARRRFLALAPSPPPRLIAAVGAGCFATRGVVCQACADHCPQAAIRFRPRIGGPALPDINAATCTGCGDCVAVCPTSSIQLRHADV